MPPSGSFRNASLVLLASSLTLGACNLITGAEDLVFDDGNGNGGGGNGGGGVGSGPTTGAGAGHTGTTSTTSTTDPGDPLEDASGVSITQIAFYQGVKATLMENGSPSSNTVPLVAGRDGLMRLFLAVDGDYNNQPVTARLTINGVDQPIEVSATVSGSPKDNVLGSTLNFNVPGASIPAGFGYRVELLQPASASKGANTAAHYPASGFASTNAQNIGDSIKIVLVPVKYGADGSNRLPDLSAQQIQGYKDLFYAMYPTPSVDLTVRAAVQYNSSVSANGTGWDGLLSYIGDVRANDNAGFGTYYYGIFSPASSANQYCGGGCVSGLGNIGTPGDPNSRAAIGLGFTDNGDGLAWDTAVHEIGHTHGRYHSPCGGAQGVDPDYPYGNAIIGVWGYNLLTKELYSPNNNTDVMGYCSPIWVSDFTYKGFFSRIKSVNNANFVVPLEMMNLTYDRARIDMDGEAHWMPSITLQTPPQSGPLELDIETDDGNAHLVGGHSYEYDHLPGGVVLWPRAGAPTSTVTFEWKGALKSLSK